MQAAPLLHMGVSALFMAFGAESLCARKFLHKSKARDVTLPGRKVTRTWSRNRLVTQAWSTQRSTQPTPEQHFWFRYTSLSARSHRRAHCIPRGVAA